MFDVVVMKAKPETKPGLDRPAGPGQWECYKAQKTDSENQINVTWLEPAAFVMGSEL